MPKNFKIGLLAISVFLLLLVCHNYKNRTGTWVDGEETTEPSAEFSKAIEEEEKLLRDPHTGKIPAGIRELELEQARQIYQKQLRNGLTARTAATNYTYQGPDNLGGRTRCLAFDATDATSNTIISGGVSGGVFKTTNGGQNWSRVNPSNQHFSVTSVVQDTRPGFTHIWYFGGGEGLGNSASAGSAAFYLGNGLYKSVDGGNTWFRLPSSNTGSLFSFDNKADFIHRIAVNPVNGDVYMACAGSIQRSQDGGINWLEVIGSGATYSSNSYTDIVITSLGRIYVAFSGSGTSSATNGVWTSATGNVGSFAQIAGSAIATPSEWNAYETYGRIVLGLAPGNQDILYALYDNGYVSSCTSPAPEAKLFRWNQAVSSWTNLSATLPDEPGCSVANDPFSVFQGYCLSIAVKPSDENTLVIGGTNAYRSTNGGTSWTRIGGYASVSSYDFYLNHHPDIHALVFSPANSNLLFSCSDGGVHKADITGSPVSWTSLNNGYQTLQYYHVAIRQDAGSTDFIGGAQDNGTTVSISGATSFSTVLTGDGVSVGLGAGPFASKQYAGAQNGIIYRRDASFSPNFIEADLTPPGVTSIFVTYFYLDPDNTLHLYYAGQVSGANKLLRINSAASANSSSWQTFNFTFQGYIRSMATTRGQYSTSSRLYIGTDAGYLYRMTNPAHTPLSTIPADITPPGMAGSGTLLGIAVSPLSQEEVLAVYSNYGTISIWHTTNAGSASPTWTNVEGNLTLPSVRTAMIVNKDNGNEYYVGTSVGLYKTVAMNGAATEWTQEASSELGNALVTSLSLRPSDNTFAIGTHGSGMWKGIVSGPLPVRFITFNGNLLQNMVQLRWTTSEEWENKGFAVERSYDGQLFKQIGFVPGGGNTSTNSSYSFADNELPQVENYYRLKQIDLNGSSRYSTVILVKNILKTPSSLTVLGNPFGSFIDIQLPPRRSTSVFVRLVDMKGSIMYEERINNSAERIRLRPKEIFPGGVYLLQLIDGDKLYTTKVLKR